jgi:hypothetical protein
MRAILVAALALASFPVAAQTDVTADQIFATVGRCTVEVSELRRALAEAKAKIAELSKPPEAAK